MRKSIIIISVLALMPFSVQSVQYGFYGRGNDFSSRNEMYSPIYSNSNGSRNSLGLSSGLSIKSGLVSSGSASFSGGSSSGMTYGRTGSLSSPNDGYSVSFSGGLYEMANLSENDGVSQKKFMEPPGSISNSPIGDAVVPLLLLLLMVVVYKRFR